MTLVGCNKQNAEHLASRADAAIQSDAKTAILAALKDPDSAQFKDFLCMGYECTVMVNAKNSMGGYTGFTKMYYNQRTGKVEDFGR
jgi:hypothetical protein